MSGLEPLAALGLACNILQLIEVGCTTIKLAKNIYQSSSPAIDQSLQDNAAVLSSISSEVKGIKRPATLSKLDQQLVATADKCSTAARDLEEEVRFLLSNAKQNQLAAALKIVAKTTWRKRRLDRLKESLENAEKLMTKTILAQIWSRTRAVELDLSNVKDDLRAFIRQYSNGTNDIKQLVSSENLRTRKHISAASKETLKAIGGVQTQMTRLTLEADMQINQALRDRLLRSLKFPGFNERRNQVREAHTSTFEWIFVGDDDPSQENVKESDLGNSDWEDSDLEDIDLADPSELPWDIYSNWLSSTSNIYWISGKPGSGKTTLVKYLLDHPKTAAYLEAWSPGALIISHFFWRPGTSMQQSIKGLLCSLLYQLLDHSEFAIEYLLQNIQDRRSGMKDADADWSDTELRSVFLQTLHSYNRPVCIFIDGLDEVKPSEGPLELLDLLEDFLGCRNAKLCLSSRPEPILEQRLSSYPHLRLQDLTRTDLERYAQDHVKLAKPIFTEMQSSNLEADKNPIRLLVDKAEGVFLWLILATRSINKGFSHGDTGAMMRQRIDLLPEDLTMLYKDMWDRACADNPLTYRQMAALYFKLILLSRRDPASRAANTFHASTLLQLMLASTSVADQLLDAVENPSSLLSEKNLLKCCKIFARGLKLYCSGLVDAYPAPLEGDSPVGWYGSHYDTLWLRYGRRHVEFVHRTAQDFLLDTVNGREILNYDSTSESSLLFKWTRAHLAISQLYANPGILMVARYVDLLEYLLSRFPWSDDADRARTILRLKALCESGQLLSGGRNRARYCGGTDFLNVAATVYYEQLLLTSELSSLPAAKLSEILLNVCTENVSLISPLFKLSTQPLIKMLLSEGADPNWRGSDYELPMFHPLGFSEVLTPFIQYLATILSKLALSRHPRWARTSIGPDSIAAILRNMHMLLSHSANLGDHFHIVGSYYTTPSTHIDYHRYGVRRALEFWNAEKRVAHSYLILQVPAHIVLNAVLDHLEIDVGSMRQGNETQNAELVSLLSKHRKYLDAWSKKEHGRVIGRLAYQGSEDSKDNHLSQEGVWYTPLEGYGSAFSDEVIESLAKGLLKDFTFSPSEALPDGRFQEMIDKMPWTLQATGFQETCKSLTELGILARTDYEVHDEQLWVEKFQKRLFSDGRVVDDGSTISESQIE